MAKAKTKKRAGRPRIEVDLNLLMTLSEAGCSQEEIAAMLQRSGVKVDVRTIKRRCAEPDLHDAWLNGQLCGKAKLRSQMVRQSRLMNGAGVQMAIHLSKHWLGMTEKAALEVNGNVEVDVTSARERVTRKIDDIAKRIESRVAGLAAAVGAKTVSQEAV